MEIFDFNSVSKINLFNSLDKLQNAKILVIGDIILDEYLFGNVERISPEAPVPVINAKKRIYQIGGAGNVVRNLNAIGCKYYLISATGQDQYEKKIDSLLKSFIDNTNNNILILKINNRKTTRKIRVIAQNQQLLRIDWEDTTEIENSLIDKILNFIEKIISNIDAIIISDYGKGMITKYLIEKLSYICKGEIPLIVDPKKENFSFYRNSFCITPNIKESEKAVKFRLKNFSDFTKAGWKIIKEANLKYLLMTLSEKGMLLFDRKNKIEIKIPVIPVDVSDVTGAGDTAISFFAASVAVKNTPQLSALISSLASSITVKHLGVYSPSLKEIKKQIELYYL